jgi:murein L,D-transpeptidase YcbB/YkuD
MRRGVKALENSRDQLAWLVLRVVAARSPCKTTSLIAYVSGGGSMSELERTASHSHRRDLIFNALLKLKALAFIELTREKITITDEGRRFLDELPVVALRTRRPYAAFSSALARTLLAESPRLERFCQDGLARIHAFVQRDFQMHGDRAWDIALQLWKREVAPMIGSRATTLGQMLKRLASMCRTRAEAWAGVLGNWRGQTGALLWKAAKASGLPPNAKLGRRQVVVFGGALLVIAFSTAGGVALLSGKPAESSQGTPIVFDKLDRSSSPADAAELDAPATLVMRTEAVGMTAPSDVDHKASETDASQSSPFEQRPADSPGTLRTIAEQPPTDPVIAAIRLKLADPALRQGTASEDLAALESFYAERSAPPLWMTPIGFSAKAQAVISEIQDADAWGLSAAAFGLPAAGDRPATAEVQAADEVELDIAILKYARFARGGRLTPSRVSVLFDQKPELRDPKTVLTEVAASAEPRAYLRSLHPKHEQFERLRQALLQARAKSKPRGKKPANERDIQRLIINMERWRWMPTELGSYYAWNNIPEFLARVVKNGKTIYVEKTIVGQPKYPTPIFSAEMRSIVFHPEWVVPETIIKEDLQPSLRQGGFFGAPNTAILEEHNLTVSYGARRVDANSIDWVNANIWQYTFTQAPGPDNVLGALKFNFPNKHAIYMHDTVQPELFAETVRTLSHGCIRVNKPDRLATLLLAEDKGWSAQQVKNLLAKDTSSVVPLNRPLPVHLTYFTAVVDEEGKVQTFADVYGLDSSIGAALFGKGGKFKAPTVQADARESPRKSSWRAAEQTGSLTDSISGLFGN